MGFVSKGMSTPFPILDAPQEVLFDRTRSLRRGTRDALIVGLIIAGLLIGVAFILYG